MMMKLHGKCVYLHKKEDCTMDEFVVSALKYRPLTFDSVVGQRSLTTTLKNAIRSGKLAHAYLFSGPRGVGKTTCARIFAKAINCMDPQADGEACCKCESCVAFEQQRSMNIHELDAASNNSVDNMRELCKQVLIPPQVGRYKVFIIDEVHMLSSQAFNAFLKTLEEPPSYVVFILATTEKHKILPTILSRCQVYDFQRMTTENTIAHLKYVAEKEGYTAEPEALALIAEKADGGMRDALSIFDQMVSFSGGNITYESVCQNLNVLSQEYYFQLVDHFLAGQALPCLTLLSEVLLKGFDGGSFIGGLASHMRNLMVSRDAATLPLLEMSDRMRSRYQEQAQRCDVPFIYRVLQLANTCDQNYRTSRNKRLQVELCLMQCCLSNNPIPRGGAEIAAVPKPTPAAQSAPVVQPVPVAQSTPAAQSEPVAQSASVAQSAPVAQPSPAPVAQPSPVVQSAPVAQPSPVAQSAPVTQSSPATPRKLPKASFKHFGASKTQETSDEGASAQEPQLHEPINEEGLTAAWYAFVTSLPHENVALAQRLRGLMPVVKDADTALLMVSNPQVKQTVEGLMFQLLAIMRKSLRNASFGVDIVIEEKQQVAKAYSPTEMLSEMKEHNEPLRELVDSLRLVID